MVIPMSNRKCWSDDWVKFAAGADSRIVRQYGEVQQLRMRRFVRTVSPPEGRYLEGRRHGVQNCANLRYCGSGQRGSPGNGLGPELVRFSREEAAASARFIRCPNQLSWRSPHRLAEPLAIVPEMVFCHGNGPGQLVSI